MKASRVSALACCALAACGFFPTRALGQPLQQCSHTVIFTLPGVTWAQVQRYRPPALLAAARHGAIGSVSVRTIRSITNYASGFATIGAGARVDGGARTGGPRAGTSSGEGMQRGVRVAGLKQLKNLAARAGYQAAPGALGSALGTPLMAAVGNADRGTTPPGGNPSRWSLLAAMNEKGVVGRAATGPEILEPDRSRPFGVRTDPRVARRAIRAALALECSSIVIDPGDLERAEALEARRGAPLAGARQRALEAADRLLGYVRTRLGTRDLLLVVSPTSPRPAAATHLGVAIAEGPGFPWGSSLESATTRRAGIVTLPDVAPTVLAHEGDAQPSEMTGRQWRSVPAVGSDRVEQAIALDRESIFVDDLKGSVSLGFIVFQVLVYAIAVLVITLSERSRTRLRGVARRVLAWGSLLVAGFPATTFLGGLVSARAVGTVWYLLLLAAAAAVLATLVSVVVRDPLDRLLVVVGFSTAVIALDLVSGGALQLNTVFGYSPIVAGRFAGIGNVAYSVLAAASLLTGTLIVHRGKGSAWALGGAGLLFIVTVVIDGAPSLGSDVGGTVALVPGLGVTWVLLTGRRPGWRAVLIAAGATLAVVALFLTLDLARPADQQTHLARLFEDVRSRGGGILADTLARKARANLHIFTVTIWTYFIPPALAVIAYLLVRPSGRWRRIAQTFPRIRAGLLGGLVLGVLGFTVNDSGIVIPGVMLSLLVPAALLLHLSLEEEEAPA